MYKVIGMEEEEESLCIDGNVQQGTEFSRVTAVGKKLFLNLPILV